MITGTYNLTVNPQWINVQQQEVFLECDTTLAPVTINLFEIAELNRFWGVKIIISDANNNAGTNNITVNASGSDTVDDDTTNQIVINTNGSSVSFQVASETQWLAIESLVAGLTPTAPYKVYTALLTQTGINPPVATILENTLGFVPTFNYGNVGSYFTSNPNFLLNKTTVNIFNNVNAFSYSFPCYITLGGIFFNSILSGVPSDNVLSNTCIEIRIYN
jgi:hypothetical protein